MWVIWGPRIFLTGRCTYWCSEHYLWGIHPAYLRPCGRTYPNLATPLFCRWACRRVVEWRLLNSWCRQVRMYFILPTYWETLWGWPWAHMWAGRNLILETDTGFLSFGTARVVQTDNSVCVSLQQTVVCLVKCVLCRDQGSWIVISLCQEHPVHWSWVFTAMLTARWRDPIMIKTPSSSKVRVPVMYFSLSQLQWMCWWVSESVHPKLGQSE